ncbi:hypothetical protein TNIN_107851 [Trichonephila inaurata madagascariensis]|uniref:Uncharacterized protein n=1 Tax=Trichonephila inaurata madagascariensis TaxID=2747483 RepID=A0A8X6YL01_9ARAC|nr:hypothetical protein TNIN_107851 [Trichonephila inaurata madagascariensis]
MREESSDEAFRICWEEDGIRAQIADRGANRNAIMDPTVNQTDRELINRLLICPKRKTVRIHSKRKLLFFYPVVRLYNLQRLHFIAPDFWSDVHYFICFSLDIAYLILIISLVCYAVIKLELFKRL